MRLANVNGRAVLLRDETSGYDIAALSAGRFGPDLPAIYEQWEEFAAWATAVDPATKATAFERADLRAPSPAPRQILAVGLNYSKHAAESGYPAPTSLPPLFTKFASALAGPDCTVVLPDGGNTDWEVELVAVVGKTASNVTAEEAWDHVAGLTIGQDLSERVLQMAATPPQFSLGKSFPNFAPTGPWLVTPDEFADRNDIVIGCSIDGEKVQQASTREQIYPIAQLIAELTKVVTLFPGDLLFTGTPEGVGLGRTPQRWLEPGQHLRTWAEGIGELNQVFVSS